jgi:hypothetical protein
MKYILRASITSKRLVLLAAVIYPPLKELNTSLVICQRLILTPKRTPWW